MTRRMIEADCLICGEHFEEPHHDSKDDGICFKCDFWKSHWLRDLERSDWVVIKGHHYVIGSENDPPKARGFGGSKFIIEFFDGRKVETTNLWHQGEITPWWREKMPDNAKFVEARFSEVKR